jgi:hypothetical protein
MKFASGTRLLRIGSRAVLACAPLPAQRNSPGMPPHSRFCALSRQVDTISCLPAAHHNTFGFEALGRKNFINVATKVM